MKSGFTSALALALACVGCSNPAEAELTPSAGGLPPPRCERVTFRDDFDKLRLYRDAGGIWTPYYPYAGPDEVGSRTLKSNGERQVYVDPRLKGSGAHALGLNPFRVRNGHLQIIAAPVRSEHKAALWGYDYASGLLTTKDAFSQTYGYFEMRAKMPKGRGLWPAFWLLPATGKWPPEIDIVEVIGHQPSIVNHAAHWTEGGKKRDILFPTPRVDTSAGFHTYGVEWTPETIRWFFDGQESARIATPADLNQPMYMLLNLAVGGHWPGKVDPKILPAALEVDYVRACALPHQGQSGD